MIAKKQIISPHLFSEKKKKQYFAKLNEKKITNKRTFWQTVKQFLSDKNKSREKITLLKNEETTSDKIEVANTLNSFFSNTVKNLKIPETFADHYLPHSLSRQPTFNAILKYKDHPSIHSIKRVSRRFSSFYFSPVDKNTVIKQIRKLKSNKAVQDTRDIPVKILKGNAEFFFGIYLSSI